MSALTTLDEIVLLPTEDARKRYDSLEGMCFLPYGLTASGSGAEGFHVETRSHPPTDERIARLRKVAAELETAS